LNIFNIKPDSAKHEEAHALRQYNNERVVTLFLAGGITNCPEWQQEAVNLFCTMPGLHGKVVLYNPRCDNFDVGDSCAAAKQIAWEHERLNSVDFRLFWFCDAFHIDGSGHKVVQPISLLEYGKWMHHPNLVVGSDPDYARCFDVRVQTGLENPLRVVHETLEATVQYAANWCVCAHRGLV